MDSNNVEGRQNGNDNGNGNGIYSNQFENIYPNAPSNGYDSNWAFGSADNSGNSVGRSTPLYATNWQQTPTSNAPIDTYARPYSKSPSFNQQSPYAAYGDPRQFQQSPYDPSLVASTPSDHQYGLNHSPYGQPSLSGGTIAPRALESEPPRTTQINRFDQQVSN